jgi:hypothetical protein
MVACWPTCKAAECRQVPKESTCANASMLRVYCERGAYRKELAALQRASRIELVHFPYEGKNKKVQPGATPSLVTADGTYLTADSSTRIGDLDGSAKLSRIREILGSSNEYDARHLDSAFKSSCDCFLTPDKADIARNAEALEHLLGLRIFHNTDDWEAFLEFVTQHA